MTKSLISLALFSILGFSGCTQPPNGAVAENISINPAAPPIAEADGRKLLSDFTKAQFKEMKQVRDRHTQELKELTKKQKVELTELEKQSSAAEKKFYKDHRGEGRLIRDFVKDSRNKHDQFKKDQLDVRRKRRQEQESERKAMLATQDSNREIFRAYLKKGLRPPESLWPTPTNL